MSLLRNVKKIHLRYCSNCETLPSLGPSVTSELIDNWNEIFEIYWRHLKGFPSLQVLRLERMPSLEKWEFPSDASFPLCLNGCPKLETLSIFMPTSCCFRKLNSLQIGDVSFPMQFLRNLTALQTLGIHNNKESILSDEIENLTVLKSLKIIECEKLISLPEEGLQKLTSLNLNSFRIFRCNSIKSLPAMGKMIQQGMMMKSSCCSLVSLEIDYCSSLTSVSEGLEYLTSLEQLEIRYCDELQLKREDFQHLNYVRNLTELQSLRIQQCDELELKKEDFHHLTSLRHLNLSYLPKLTSIPDVQNLTSIQSLSVTACHRDLHKRLKRDKGVDWPNISHIPEIKINDSEETMFDW
ncbi:hypothetical protein AQUCO_07100030v1 [Aquilegia coerulea]|uniref:Uncharacterized protein n=1 Tax=Aquilegia coerulea TaxID=218851 RepID=A0A2G5CAR4_AQUCA|nr:hypothetical protein AQUCO_07100030v1 [Aquilegia coerulea]